MSDAQDRIAEIKRKTEEKRRLLVRAQPTARIIERFFAETVRARERDGALGTGSVCCITHSLFHGVLVGGCEGEECRCEKERSHHGSGSTCHCSEGAGCDGGRQACGRQSGGRTGDCGAG